MFENFTRTEIKTSGARIVTVHGGNGPPLLLMHGNPFTHASWHKFAPRRPRAAPHGARPSGQGRAGGDPRHHPSAPPLQQGATGAVGRIHKPAEIWKHYALT
jgi:pimeloyl-ACP methyl ester carboxylesterase